MRKRGKMMVNDSSRKGKQGSKPSKGKGNLEQARIEKLLAKDNLTPEQEKELESLLRDRRLREVLGLRAKPNGGIFKGEDASAPRPSHPFFYLYLNLDGKGEVVPSLKSKPFHDFARDSLYLRLLGEDIFKDPGYLSSLYQEKKGKADMDDAFEKYHFFLFLEDIARGEIPPYIPKEDVEGRLHYLEGAAGLGSEEATLLLLLLLEKGVVPGGKKRAKQLIKPFVEREMAEACYLYGRWLLEGEFLEKNEAMAFLCFLKSAEKGYPKACKRLSTFYKKGIIVSQDDEKASFYEALYQSKMKDIEYLARLKGRRKVMIR